MPFPAPRIPDERGPGGEPRPAPRARRAPARGFTLIEIMVAILIIFTLMGLLFVGFRQATALARGTVDRQTVLNIANAAGQFQKDFGFPPPLVQDVTQKVGVEPAGGEFKVWVYDLADKAPTGDRQKLFERLADPVADPNPFRDPRYSEFTLAYYLVGALPTLIKNGAPGDVVPIDGVAGNGFYRPNRDGTFDVPAELKASAKAPVRNRSGSRFESFLNLGGATPKLVVGDAAASTAAKNRAVVTDRNGVAIRYYLWINGSGADPRNPGVYLPIEKLADLRLPPLVGRDGSLIPEPTPADRDVQQNPELRDATWAVVAAGPDGLFGDEEDDGADLGRQRLETKYGRMSDPAQERTVRIKAEKDNIVKVGR